MEYSILILTYFIFGLYLSCFNSLHYKATAPLFDWMALLNRRLKHQVCRPSVLTPRTESLR